MIVPPSRPLPKLRGSDIVPVLHFSAFARLLQPPGGAGCVWTEVRGAGLQVA